MRLAEAVLAPQSPTALRRRSSTARLLARRDGPLIGYVQRLLRSYCRPRRRAAAAAAASSNARLCSWSAVRRSTAIRGIPLSSVTWPRHRQPSSPGRALRSRGAARRDRARAHRRSIRRPQLPRFAIDRARPARRRITLFPIGALETHLLHCLGDPLLLRAARSRAHLAGATAADRAQGRISSCRR